MRIRRLRMLPALLSWTAPLLIVACSRRTEPPAMPMPPTTWQAPTVMGDHVHGWVSGLGDEQLLALVAEAHAANRDLAAAAARLESARAQAIIIGSESWPALSASAEATRARSNPLQLPGGTIDNRRYALGGQISWELDLWGRVRAGRLAATASADAIDADLAAARLSVTAQVVRSWLAARAALVNAALAQHLGQNLAAALASAEEQFANGLLPIDTVRELRSARAAAADREADARLRAGAAVRAVEILLGRIPTGTLSIAADMPPLPQAVPAGIPADVLARRPDVRAMELRLRSADAQADSARASLYPRLSLTTSAGYAGPDLGRLLDGDFGVWSLAANLLQPIVQGGRLQAGVVQARADRDAAAHAFAQTMLRALGEVEDALHTAAVLTQRERLQVGIVDEATALAALAGERLDAGLGDVLAVLAAQRGVLEAELSLIGVRSAILTNHIDLHLALGGEALPARSPAP